MVSKSTAFANAFLNTYATVTRAQQERDRHELEMAKARDEQEMRSQLKAVDADVKPTQGYVVQGADGTRTVFADAEQARQAAGDSAAVIPSFIVRGQTYGTQEEADRIAERFNSPAAKMRQRADIALKYNRADLADGFLRNYQSTIEANRADAFQQYQQARLAGDLSSVEALYNQQFSKPGTSIKLQQGKDGQIIANRFQNGELVGSTPMGSGQEFWDRTGQMIAETPANALEAWKTREGINAQNRKLANDERETEAKVGLYAAQGRHLATGDQKTLAEIALMPEEMAIRRMQASASMTGASAAAANAATNRAQLTMPRVSAVPDDKGNLNYVAVPQLYDAKSGQWSMGAPQTQAAAGMRYPAIATQEARNAGGLGALMNPQPQINWDAVGSALGNLPAKNLGGKPAASPAAVPALSAPAMPATRPGVGVSGAAAVTPEQQRYLQWVQQQNGR